VGVIVLTRDKVVLVTGASRGIGRGIAKLAGARGWAVGVNYRVNVEAADEVVGAIEAAGGCAVAVRADVADANAVAAMFNEVQARFGRVTALVNNAGEVPMRQDFDAMSDEAINRTIAVNLLGPINCMRRATALFKEAGGGDIVNIGSEAGRFGGNRISIYAATKAALAALSVGTARELGRYDIRVNTVSPGAILTDALGAEGEEALDRIRSTIPSGRIGAPEEVAEAVLWLLSKQSSYVSGSLLTVSGAR
jgi:NAD(P)-dependent dehydrogenase (short-subunit alcohol dehydrogenase family)